MAAAWLVLFSLTLSAPAASKAVNWRAFCESSALLPLLCLRGQSAEHSRNTAR